tara:strand:+ start:399 stop:566 length:168 start_codon:yes stop_codon:yes gene_type:complete
MNLFWLIGIAFVILCAAALFVEGMMGDTEKGNGVSTVVGILASILFVLIMIYDKL